MHARSSLFSLLGALTAIACGGQTETAGPALSAAQDATATAEAPGVVYALSNDPAGNAVVAFARAPDGTLSPAGSFPTGGTGTGAPRLAGRPHLLARWPLAPRGQRRQR